MAAQGEPIDFYDGPVGATVNQKGPGGNITVLASTQARALFAQHTIAVGSTGNLGLSVGIAARALGFRAVVHMSSDAKQWKVERLTRLGVEVVQHKADYTTAVECARIDAEGDPTIYFVDDERTEMLFFGYSAAASELAAQLEAAGVTVDEEHPLFIYLPCGIGGAPGGAAYGLKAIFGDAAHAFFVEPVQSPCALVHILTRSFVLYPLQLLASKLHPPGCEVSLAELWLKLRPGPELIPVRYPFGIPPFQLVRRRA